MKKQVLLIVMMLMPLMASAYDVMINGIYYNLNHETKQAGVTHDGFYSGSYFGDVVIPKSVSYNGATYSVTSIEIQAFYECSGLTSVTIPNSVASIGTSAFVRCTSLTSVTVPNSVTHIWNYAFYECSGLTSVTIPNSVIHCGYHAFSGCLNIASVNITDLTAWCNIYFDDWGCPQCAHLYLNGEEVKDLVVPNSVKAIGNWAFCGCAGLTSVTIPNSVTTIGKYAFCGSGLTSVTIPNGLTTIGNRAFRDCENLTDIFCYADIVPTTNSNAFENTNINNVTLHVPFGSINKYQTTYPWNGFGSVVSFTPVYKLTYIVDGKEYKSYEYEEGKIITPEPTPTKEGYSFSGWSEIPDKMPAHDVMVTGSFLLIPQCAKPTITLLANGKIKVESATEGATCVTNITASNAEPLSDGEISLNTPLIVYTVTSYATKEGYNDSEVATATFRYEKTEGDMNGDGMLNITDVIHLVNMILSK